MKSKSTAVLFAIILGGLGIHHFYLGDTKKGLCYLIPWVVFSWLAGLQLFICLFETYDVFSIDVKVQNGLDLN